MNENMGERIRSRKHFITEGDLEGKNIKSK